MKHWRFDGYYLAQKWWISLNESRFPNIAVDLTRKQLGFRCRLALSKKYVWVWGRKNATD